VLLGISISIFKILKFLNFDLKQGIGHRTPIAKKANRQSIDLPSLMEGLMK